MNAAPDCLSPIRFTIRRNTEALRALADSVVAACERARADTSADISEELLALDAQLTAEAKLVLGSDLRHDMFLVKLGEQLRTLAERAQTIDRAAILQGGAR